MAEELQSLINRIQQDGIARAETEARRILSEANEQAAGIVRAAETRAQALLAEAEQAARTYDERANKALQQAARDVVLSVQEAVTRTLQAIVAARVGEALSIDVLKQMLVRFVEAYAARNGETDRIDLLVDEADRKAVVEYFLQQYRAAIDRGVEIHAEAGIGKGFRVAIQDAHLRHDFTRQDIAEALGRLLRPRLAEIVKQAAANP